MPDNRKDDEDVDHFFKALAGEHASEGEAPPSAQTGAAVRGALIRQIETSQSRELAIQQIVHRERLIEDLKDQGFFKDKPQDRRAASTSPESERGLGSSLKRWFRRYSFRPFHLLILLMVIAILAAVINTAIQPNPDKSPERQSPVADPSPVTQAKQDSNPYEQRPSSLAPSGFPAPATATVLPREASAMQSPPEVIQLTVSNTSGKVIDGLYVRRSDGGDSGREVLGKEKLGHRERIQLTMRKADSCLYTFTATFNDQTQRQMQSVNVCSAQTIEFGP